MPNSQLRKRVYELIGDNASMEGYFLLAVALRMPDFSHEIIDRAQQRERSGDYDSPILNAIYDAALEARLAIIAGNFIGDAHSYVDAAVERAAVRVLKLLARDTVLPFSRSWRESE